MPWSCSTSPHAQKSGGPRDWNGNHTRRGFCVALARLNTPASVASLEEYLDVYLSRVELFFDQGEAMAALGYLDAQNGTARRARFMPRWQRFVENKPRWDLTRHDNLFRVTMDALERVATSVD